MIIYYIFDEINLSNYYFIIFYDRNINWLFSNDDAEVGLILIKNLFLKLKTIHYTEKIRSNTLIDFVTGLYNAPFMWNKLEELININKTSAAPFSMAVLDLNDFKIINNTYWNFVGDEAIRFFSKILRVAVGGHNHVICYCGDEFVIIFLKASKTEAEKNKAKVKSICASQPYIFNERSIYLDFANEIDEYSSQYDSSKSFFNIIDK